MVSQAILHLTDDSFDQTLAQHAEPIVVDFWAEWCGPCKAIAPVLEELAQEYAGRVTIAKVNVDDYQALAARFGVRSIPTLLFFKSGKVVDQVVGAVPRTHLRKRLDAVA
jgi:thioredoxin